MNEDERLMLRRLADKWEGEAEIYDARRDDDYSREAMMLRYCAVQLQSAVPAERQHEWQFYANGSFCRRCGARIGSGSSCR